MLYQVGAGTKYSSLGSLVASKPKWGQNDTVQLVSDIAETSEFQTQSGMTFDGLGHTITQNNPKAGAIMVAGWCSGATVQNYKAKTTGNYSSPTSALDMLGKDSKAINFSQIGSGRLFTASGSVNCSLTGGVIESDSCPDYAGWAGVAYVGGPGPTNLSLTKMIMRLWGKGMHVIRTQMVQGDKGVTATDCEFSGENLDANGHLVGEVRSCGTFKEFGNFTFTNCTFSGMLPPKGSNLTLTQFMGQFTLAQLFKRLALGNIGKGYGPLQVDTDPTDHCTNVTLNQCTCILGNFLSLLAGVYDFTANGGLIIAPQVAINCSGSINGRKPPDTIKLVGTNLKSSGAFRGPGTNVNFQGCPITLPDDSIHKVNTNGSVI